MPVPAPGLSSRSPAPDYSLQFQTFSQRDCYDAGPRRSLSRGAHTAGGLVGGVPLGGPLGAPLGGPGQEGFYGGGVKRAGKRLVDSPPDGLNLGQSTVHIRLDSSGCEYAGMK